MVLSTGQFQTSRLALSDGSKGERLRWLQFCCQPLLSSAGGLEGVLTIVAEATEEIEIEDRVGHVIDLLTQQIAEIEQPTSRLTALMNRVRGLDDFLPRENVMPVELVAVEDTLSEDQLHYRALLDGTAVEGKAKSRNGAQRKVPPPYVVPAAPAHQSSTDILQESISAEAASAIQAFEDSFSIDLDANSNTESVTEPVIEPVIEPVAESDEFSATEQEQDIFASQTDFAPLQETSEIEELHDAEESEPESNLDRSLAASAADMDAAALYLPTADDDTQLWSEFSDFSAERMSQVDDLSHDDDENRDLLEPLVEEQPQVMLEQPDQEPDPEQNVVSTEAPPLTEEAVEITDESLAQSGDATALADAAEETSAETSVIESEISVTILEEATPAPVVTRAAAGKCALIVDDIPVNQKLLVLQLKRLNFATDIANNGQEALNRLAKFDYDIVFMDCDMPVMNGYDATIAIRKIEIESGRHIPIVAMTSYDRDADKERCLAAGMDDYLTKGVNASSLSRVIERCCDKAKKEEGDGGFGIDNSETEPFDAAVMASNYGKEELNEVVRLFLSSMEIFVNSMQKAIDSRDGALVTSLANSIKGPSATLGLHLITKVTNDILTFSEVEDWPQVRLKYLKLKTVYLRSQEQLRKLCPDVFTEGAHLFG